MNVEALSDELRHLLAKLYGQVGEQSKVCDDLFEILIVENLKILQHLCDEPRVTAMETEFVRRVRARNVLRPRLARKLDV